mmetsp:Transcript_10297/g.19766  ORF Transcript_10297/g.19766 Transcript_10297/m.19766 type:complete len:93 (+) Transcript_10297:605-883(+)
MLCGPCLCRDIKPGSLHLDSNFNIKIVMSGSLCKMGTQIVNDDFGTETYLPPEARKRESKGPDPKAPFMPSLDIWSAGATLFALLSGPFSKL